jgi:hypothetical protein
VLYARGGFQCGSYFEPPYFYYSSQAFASRLSRHKTAKMPSTSRQHARMEHRHRRLDLRPGSQTESLISRGVWFGGGPFGNIEDGLPPGESVPLLPEARTLKASRLAKDDPVVNCLPAGVPRAMLLPWRIVQTPTHIFFLFEADSYRQIFMDGRQHPGADAVNPTWYGHSVGHWDGDTLVVDTIGFNDRTWLDYVGHPHTERLHVVERWTRREFGTLENQITIDDPGAYARPFTATFRARLLPGIDVMEYICNENNKAPASIKGLAEDNRPNPSR